MNHVDVMKRALEALEYKARIYREYDPEDGPPEKMTDAIIDLSEAIAHAEKQEPVAVVGDGFQLLWARHDWSRGIKVGDKLYAAPPAAQPVSQSHNDLAYKEAVSLATALFKKHFAHEEDYASGKIAWGLCDTTAGVISQIDNMVSGLVRPAAQQETDSLHLAAMDLARKQADRIAELEAELFAGMFVGMLDANASTMNYIEVNFDTPHGPIVVTVMRPDGKTPHQLQMDAEQRVSDLESEVARFRADAMNEKSARQSLEQQLAEFVRVGTLYSESGPIDESGWRFTLGGQQCTGFAVEWAVFIVAKGPT
jgi:hypothetical protein